MDKWQTNVPKEHRSGRTMSLLSIEATRPPQRCNTSKPVQIHLTGQYKSLCSCLFFLLEPADPGLISREGSPLYVTRPPHPHSHTLFTISLIMCYHGEPSLLIRANFCCQETPFGPFQLRPAPFKHHPSLCPGSPLPILL